MPIELKSAIKSILTAVSAGGVCFTVALNNQIIKLFNETIFYLIILFLLILLTSLLTLKFGSQILHWEFKSKKWLHKKAFYFLVLCIVGSYGYSLFFDFFVIHQIFYSAILLMIGLMISLVLTRYSYRLALFCVLFLFLSYAVAIYAFYPPSLGNNTDPWRDCNVALTIRKSGYIGSVTNEAYRVPIVSIVYAELSLILNISSVNASALMGLLYISIIAILAFLISKKIGARINCFSSLMAVILILSIPLVMRLSILFTPESYALIIVLTFLLVIFPNINKNNNFLVTIPFLIAIVLGHGGIDLWFIGFLTCLLILMRFFGLKYSISFKYIEKILLLLVVMTLFYFAYTVGLLKNAAWGFNNILSLLLNFVATAGTSTNVEVSSGSPFLTALLSYGSYILVAVLACIAWLGNNKIRGNFYKIFLEATFLYSLAMAFVAILGTVYFPSATLDRYLGLGSLVLLSIIAAIGLHELLNRRLPGKIFVVILTILSIATVGFGTVLTSDYNPLNITNLYATNSPVTWAERTSMYTIVSHISAGSILADWRTGQLITYSFYDQYYVQNVTASYLGNAWATLYMSQGSVSVTNLWNTGSLSTSYEYILNSANNHVLYVYRRGALDNMDLLKDISEKQLYNALVRDYNEIFSGKIEVFTG